MLESSACFVSRAEEIGLTQDEIARCKILNVDSFGKFAFGANYVPGQPDDLPLMTFIAKLCDVDPPPENRIPAIRRLFYESYTLQNAELRTRVEKKEDDPPRRLAQAERASRFTDQVARLSGLDISGELEPSHGLIDLVFSMIEDNQLKYIRWEQCTKRDQELMGIKSDPMWKPDSQGVIKEVKVQAELKADTSSDLRLKYALQRRSLALDQARLCDYEKMERWSCILLEAYSRAPIDGYRRVSIEQVQHADMEMFKHLIKMTRSGIRPSLNKIPIEDELLKALSLPEIRLHLQPLPSGSAAKRKDADDDEAPANAKKAKQPNTNVEKLQRTIENLQGQLRNVKGAGKSGGKGRGRKGFVQRAPIRMPPELIGQHPMTEDNEPICFSFNLGGCKAAKIGERCSKGWHLCTKCRGNHSQRNHAQAGGLTARGPPWRITTICSF